MNRGNNNNNVLAEKSLNNKATIGQRILNTLRIWNKRHQERQQLKAISPLSDHLLKDMGLTRYDVNKEMNKPFWRP